MNHTTLPHFYNLTNQRGALFGLDARIALAIFGVLSVVAGVAVVANMDESRAKALASELNETGHAIELMVADLNEDIFTSLDQASEKNAFAALYDNSVITEQNNLRHKWLGPYIRYTSNDHPRYGPMVIQARQADHNDLCAPGYICYLWLVYSNVKLDIVKYANALIDGENEPNPATSGRLQWSTDRDTAALYYQAAKTITYTGD